MAENNRTQNSSTPVTQTPDQNSNTPQDQKVSNKEQNVEQNPQDGKEWSNYRTREMSTNEERNSSDE